jgi:hypothetical protein
MRAARLRLSFLYFSGSVCFSFSLCLADHRADGVLVSGVVIRCLSEDAELFT